MNVRNTKTSLTTQSGHVGVLFFAGLLVATVSCASQDAIPASGFRDDLGRVVELHGDAQRIVSLSPAITELLFVLGAGGRVVGRTQWDLEPQAALSVTSVGEGMPPNVEAVAAVDPDLVVFYASEVNRRPIEQLKMLGIPSIAIKIDLLERLPRMIQLLGDAVGLQQTADSLAADFQSKFETAQANAVETDPVRVAILTWDNPPIVIGSGSFLHEMLQLAGAANVFDDIEAPSASVSIEVVADRDPDVFLVTTGTELPAYATRPEWQTLRAVATRSFALVDGTEFQWPSLRSLSAIPRLRTAIANAAAHSASNR